jgi:uncharacterized membrane protein
VTRAAWRAPALARRLGWALCVALGVLPLLSVLSALLPALAPLERASEPWFALHCHREPERTLRFAGVALTVCARCSGIYFGLGLGALLRRPRFSPRALRLAVGGAAIAMLIDVLLERAGWHGPWTWLRLLTGLLLAYPVGVGLGEFFARAPGAAQSP